jgi:hypothetical protein
MSSKPTTQPSARPSHRPSSQPSSRTSFIPTASPVRKGIIKTSRPSVIPTPAPSSRPTVASTAAPTLSLASQWKVRLANLLEQVTSKITSPSVIFSDLIMNGTAVDTYAATCSNWNQFYSRVATAGVSKQLVGLTLAYTFSLNVSTSANKLFACGHINSLASLESAVVNGSTVSVSCGDNEWSVGSCDENLAICVNCTKASVAASYVNSFNPCSSRGGGSNCLLQTESVSSRYASYARVLIATFAVIVPTVEEIFVRAVAKNSISVHVKLDQYGAAFCAAFALSLTPTSTQKLLSAGFSGWTDNNSVNLTITSLLAATDYYVYCVSMSARGQYSDIAGAIADRVLVTTSCCRTISFGLITKSVYGDTGTSKMATIAVSTLPTSTLLISLSAIHANTSGIYSASILFPMSITLSSASAKVFTIAFVGASSAGVYNISIGLSGEAATDYTAMFSNGFEIEILSRLSTPLTPLLQQAQFSSDGSTIGITFDSSTDKGRVSNVNNFACSQLFEFTGASRAKCQWNAGATTVTVTPSKDFPLAVGSLINVVANKIQASCPSVFNSSVCATWTAISNRSGVGILSPASPIRPSVYISVPSAIGSCDSLSLDFSSSTGSGGRAWSTANVSLTSTKALNTSGLTAFLAKSTVSGPPRVTIPSGHLSRGYQYTFTVTLCSFLGACGLSSASVSVLNIATPSINIIGGPTFTIRANASLTISSSAYTVNCDGSKSLLNLQYVWSISLLNGTASTLLSVASVSKDPTKFALQAYRLTPQYSYSVVLTVTNSLSLKSSSTSVVVSVLVSDLVLLISGGSQQSVRLTHSFSVDASGSYDSDQAAKGVVGIFFSWDCYQTVPTYSLVCPVTLGLTNISILSGLANISSANSTSLVSLSMYDDSRVATGTVSLLVLDVSAALVRIASTFSSAVLSTSGTILQGSVAAVASVGLALRCTWSVDDTSVDLDISSYVTPSQLVSITSVDFTYNFYLSLAPNSLPTGASMIFTLACIILDTSTGSCISTSSAVVEILINAPPTPGVCSVTPLSGEELSTKFEMIASYWVDDDTPISYEFGFLSSSSNTTLVVQTKGLNSFVSTYLAAGPSLKNYSLTTSIQVFDSLGADVVEYVEVQVVSVGLNMTVVRSKTADLLAENAGNVDGMKQVISIVANTITAVNCSQSPNCTALHRLDCLSTPQTCGACASDDYVGASGDSNTMCVLITDYYGTSMPTAFAGDGQCDSSVDCNGWNVCELSSHACVPASKDCVSNCTSGKNGDCIFIASDSLEILEACSVSDTQCEAVCVCRSGFYGSDCSLTEIMLRANQDTTGQLMISLLQVKDLETLDSQSSIYLSNALLLLTTNSYFLDDSAASTAYNISFDLLQGSGVVTSSSVTKLGAVVDNLLQSSSSSTLSVRRRMSISSVLNDSVIEDLLDSLSFATMNQMVPGQTRITSIQTNYRLSAGIIASSRGMSNVIINVPQTSLEAIANMSSSSLKISGVGDMFGNSDSLDIGVGLLTVPQYFIDTSNYINSSYSDGNASMIANAFRVTLSDTQTFNSSSACSEAYFVFSFANYRSESFGLISGNITNITQCLRGNNETVWVYCPSSEQLIPVYCNGSLPSHNVITVCPQLQKHPSCIMTTAWGSQVSCEVTNYTDISTTCRCSSCLFVENSRRRLQSTSSSYGTQILALSEYSFTEYAAVMESAASFDSISAVKDTILIIATFAVMWLGMAGFVCGTEYLRWFRARYRDNSTNVISTKVNAVAPQGSQNVPAAAIIGTGRRKSSLSAVNLESLRYNSLEDCLKEYIYELFSPAFSDDSETVRFVRELWNKHEYISVFSRKEFGAEQWISVFCLLTNLNANFFLLALFYDIQFASDDGTCLVIATETECMAKKSLLNPSQGKCSWERTSGMSSHQCVWQLPKFELLTAIVVFVIVLAVSSPITFVISCICEMILMAPALSEVEAQDTNNKVRRQSAMLMMNTASGVAENLKSPTTILPQRITDNTGSIRSPIGVRKSRSSTLFATVEEMGSSIKKVSKIAHRLSSRQPLGGGSTGGLTESNLSDAAISPDRNYKSFYILLRELRKFAAEFRSQQYNTAAKSESLQTEKDGVDLTAMEKYEDFRLFWGPLLENDDEEVGESDDERSDRHDHQDEEVQRSGSPGRHKTENALGYMSARSKKRQFKQQNDEDDAHDDAQERNSGDNSDEEDAHAAASTELKNVSKEARSWVKKLKLQSPERIGVQILELFVRDCLGQHSREAIIFSQKIRPFEQKFMMKWTIKCITFVGLCFLNIFFVFSCMLYGRDKGLAWQRGWLFSCIVNIIVDVFINAVTVAAVLYFFVPNLIVEKARSIKLVVTNIVHDLCVASGGNMRDVSSQSDKKGSAADSFSAADYFFVSAHIARAFPELLESRIVLSYKTFFLSKEQMNVINPKLERRQQQLLQPQSHQKHRRTRTSSQFLGGPRQRLGYAARFFASASVWATTLLLIFGSQSLLGQEFLISMFNPGLVAAIAYLGIAIWNNNYFGMLIAVFIVVASFSLVYWFVHHMLQRRSLAKDWLLKRGFGGTKKTFGGIVPIRASTDVALHNPDPMTDIEHDLHRRVTVHQQATWHFRDLDEDDNDVLDLDLDDDEVYSAKDTNGRSDDERRSGSDDERRSGSDDERRSGSDDERRSGSDVELDVDCHSDPDGPEDLADASDDGDYAEENDIGSDHEKESENSGAQSDDDVDEMENVIDN